MVVEAGVLDCSFSKRFSNALASGVGNRLIDFFTNFNACSTYSTGFSIAAMHKGRGEN